MRKTQPLLIDAANLHGLLPLRHKDAHKGTFGSLAVIGGAAGMVGAPLLAGRSALYSGTGRVYIGLLDKHLAVDLAQPELMLRDVNTLQDLPLTAAVIGTGIGQSAAALKLLKTWLKRDIPLVLDADALNLIAAHPVLCGALKKHGNAIITPHASEAARILGSRAEDIQRNRIKSVQDLAAKTGAISVLKGAATLIATPDGALYQNTSGNIALATAGSGDVLSGLMGSLMAQGLSAIDAAKTAVYVHGAAADALVAGGTGPIGVSASELVPAIRQQLNQLYKEKHP